MSLLTNTTKNPEMLITKYRFTVTWLMGVIERSAIYSWQTALGYRAYFHQKEVYSMQFGSLTKRGMYAVSISIWKAVSCASVSPYQGQEGG